MSGLTVRPIVQRDTSPEQVLDSLKRHLENSFKRLDREDKCAVLFSGGVDSSLAALMTKKHCNDTLLITARCEGSHDEDVAVRAAKAMSLDIAEVRIESDSLWEALPDVVHSIKTRKRMDVEIAIPFFFAAREAQERGYNLIISGQGPDELFAGYARYEKLMIERGTEKVEQALWADFSITDEANIQRDIRAISAHEVDSFFPFLNPDFARTALTIPASLNINPNQKPARKLMFRELALKFGVPREVAMTPKRATQYSSGTTKMLAKSIRNNVDTMRGLTKRELQSAIQEFLNKLE
ncbi:MAG: asparagine synthase C-terminal domain-containing protein [Candidatus Thorarchaeota archaeon]